MVISRLIIWNKIVKHFYILMALAHLFCNPTYSVVVEDIGDEAILTVSITSVEEVLSGIESHLHDRGSISVEEENDIILRLFPIVLLYKRNSKQYVEIEPEEIHYACVPEPAVESMQTYLPSFINQYFNPLLHMIINAYYRYEEDQLRLIALKLFAGMFMIVPEIPQQALTTILSDTSSDLMCRALFNNPSDEFLDEIYHLRIVYAVIKNEESMKKLKNLMMVNLESYLRNKISFSIKIGYLAPFCKMYDFRIQLLNSLIPIFLEHYAGMCPTAGISEKSFFQNILKQIQRSEMFLSDSEDLLIMSSFMLGLYGTETQFNLISTKLAERSVAI